MRRSVWRLTPLRLVVLGLLAAGPLRAAPREPPGPHADFSGWQELLDRYCIRTLDGKRIVDTRFDYEQCYVDEGIWRKQASDRLTAIRAQMFAVPPSSMAPAERLAWALNAYNFLVVERATLHLLVPGRQFLRYKSVEEMIVSQGGFFEAPVVTLEGRDYSIGQFERVFVYGDTTPMIQRRQRPGDPRLMFALCHGTVGLAPLPVRAFRADSLDRQLDDASRMALALPHLVKFDPAVPSLVVDESLDRHALDFASGGGTMLSFLERYGPAPLRSAIHKGTIHGVLRYQQTDWTLNQLLRPKPKAPVATDGKPN